MKPEKEPEKVTATKYGEDRVFCAAEVVHIT
jgi:hypothetical protein